MKKKEFTKNKSGITLVALVITVIVLLILAGISIAVLTGDHGLINQAIKEKGATDYSQIKDEVMTAWYNLQNETRKKFYDNYKMAKLLEDRLREEDADATVEYKKENETFQVTYKGYNVEITLEGQVTNNREVARKNIQETWNKIKDDPNLSEKEKLDKLADELGISRDKVTKDNDGNIIVSDYNGYSETIATDGDGNTNIDPEKETPTYTDRASVTITDEPKDLEIYAGNTANFTVEATVTGHSLYQWYEIDRKSTIGGTLIENNNSANTSTLTIPNASLDNDKYYYCVVTSKYQGRTAKEKTVAAKLTVIKKIEEVIVSADQVTVEEGNPLNISVTAEGSGKVTYQWYYAETENGTGEAIPGATSTEFSIPANEVRTDKTGYYYCVVTQEVGGEINTVTSERIKVDVKIPTVIDTQPRETGAIEGQSAEISASSRGNGKITYQWYKTSTENNTDESTPVGDPEVYEWYKEGVDNGPQDGKTSSTFKIDQTELTDDAYYYCKITQEYSPDGTTTSIKTEPVKITVVSKIAIDVAPTAQETIEGLTTRFSVTVNAEGEKEYQWYKDGQPVGQKTTTNSSTNTFEIPTTALTDAGNYYCQIKQTYNGQTETITTEPVTLTVKEVTITADDIVAYVNGSNKEVTIRGNNKGTLTITDGSNETTKEDNTAKITLDQNLNKLTIEPKTAGRTSVKVKESHANKEITVNIEVKKTTIKANNQNPLSITTHVGAVATYVILSGENAGAFSIETMPNSSYATATIAGNIITITPQNATPEGTLATMVAKEANGNQTVEISIKVNKAIPTVTLSANSGTVDYDGTTTFTATPTSTPAVDGTWTVTSSRPSNVEITAGNGETATDSTATNITYKGLAATTETTVITVIFTPSDLANYNPARGSYTVNAVNKINAINPTLTAYTGNYNGEAHTITVDPETGETLGGTIEYSTDQTNWSTTKPTRTDYGTTTVYVHVKGDSNHNTSETISSTITIDATSMTYESGDYTGVYDLNPHTITLNVSIPEGTTIYYSTETALDENNYATAGSTDKPQATNVADSTTVYWYILSNNANYNNLSGNNKITITPKNIEAGDIQVSLSETSLSYNGEEQKPGVTVTDKEATLVEGRDYTVTYPQDTTNVGTKTITITGTGNYAGTETTITYTITKVTPELTLSATEGTVNYNGTTTFTVTPTSTPAVNGTWTVTSGDLSKVQIIAPTTDAQKTATNGTATNITYKGLAATETPITITIKFTPTGSTAGNYNEKTMTYTVKAVNKINAINPTITGYTGVYDGRAHSITVNPSTGTTLGGTIQYSTDQTNWSTSNPTATNVADSKTVYVRVLGDSNHNTTEPISADITITRAEITPSVNMTGYTYGGTKSTPSVSGNTENGEVTYYYTTTNKTTGGTNWDTVTSATSLNAGTYYMYAEVNETANYNGATTPAVAFTIAKASPTVTLNNTSGAVNYDSTNTFTATPASMPAVNGTWSVTSSSPTNVGITKINNSTNITTATATNNTASTIEYKGLAATTSKVTITVVFNPSDTTNYNTAKATYTVNTVNKIQAVAPQLANTTYTYDGNAHTVTTTSNGSGGTLKYRASTNGGSSYGAWQTTAPTITNTTDATGGTLYVQAYVQGDSNHTDSSIATATCHVGVATMSVTGTDYTGTYDGKAHSITVTVTKPTSGTTIYYSTKKAISESDVLTESARTASGASTTNPTATTVAESKTVYWCVVDTTKNYATLTGNNKITINRKALTADTLSISTGPTSNLNNWDKIYGERFSNITYDSETQMSNVTFTGAANCEFLYLPIVTTQGQTYTFTCDYKNVTGFTSLGYSGYYGLGLQAFKGIPEGDGTRVALNNVVLPSDQNTTSTTYELTFTAQSPITYIAFNFGWCKDLQQLQVELGNFTLSNTWSYIYDGNAKEITTVVKDTTTGKNLSRGTDYTVAYTNNTNIGTATTTLTGTVNYTGTTTQNFTIAKKPEVEVTYDYAMNHSYEAGTYSDTGYIINWDKDFTIEEKINVSALGKRYLLFSGIFGNNKELGVEIQNNNKLRIIFGDLSIYERLAGTVVANEDITVTFTWNASTKSYTATARGTNSNASISDTYDISGDAQNALRIGSADTRTGSGSPFNPITVKSFKVTCNQEYNEAVTVPAVSRVGWTFNGWYTAASGGTQINISTTVPANATTYYAQYTVNNYTANFNGNGGTDGTPITKPYQAALGTLPTTSREGYTFNGWFTAASGGTQISASTTMPLNGATYYAHWTDDIKPTFTTATASDTWDIENFVDFTATDEGTGITGYNVTTTTTAPTTWIPVVDAVEEHTETKYQYDASWARVFHHNNHWGEIYYANADEAKSADTVDKYSVLGNLDNYKNNSNKYEFLLQYPHVSTTEYNRWIQNDNPATLSIADTGTRQNVPGFQSIHLDWSGNFNGLALSTSSSSTFIDGEVGVRKLELCNR